MNDSVYLYPYNYETARFCREFLINLNISLLISGCSGEKPIYPGEGRHLNISFTRNINIEKVLADLELAVFQKFGI